MDHGAHICIKGLPLARAISWFINSVQCGMRLGARALRKRQALRLMKWCSITTCAPLIHLPRPCSRLWRWFVWKRPGGPTACKQPIKTLIYFLNVAFMIVHEQVRKWIFEDPADHEISWHLAQTFFEEHTAPWSIYLVPPNFLYHRHPTLLKDSVCAAASAMPESKPKPEQVELLKECSIRCHTC